MFRNIFIALIGVLALGASTLVNAETLDLAQTGGWGALHQYHDVQTSDPATTVTMYLPQYTTGSQIAELWFGDFAAGNQFYGDYNNVGNQMTFTNPNTGQTVVLQIFESTRRACTYSGRGQHCSTIWTLVSGTLARPDPLVAPTSDPAIVGLE